MRSHRAIIQATGGATAVARAILPFLPPDRWPDDRALANTVQGWKRSDNVPAEYWQAFASADLATLRELAAAAAARLRSVAA